MLRRPGLLQHDPGQPTGDEGGDVDEDGWQRDTARRGQVQRSPDRIEFLLVPPQSMEVVEVFPMPVHEVAKAMPQGWVGMRVQPGKGRHAEIEPSITLLSAPKQQLREEEIHGSVGRIRKMTHEVNRQFYFAGAEPEVGE